MSDYSSPHTEAKVADTNGRLAPLLASDPKGRLDADMKHVLAIMDELGTRPLEYCTPAMARRQPGISDAIATIFARQNRVPALDGVEAQDLAIENGAAGELPVRLYRPSGLLSRLNPVVLYLHGGGFVLGDLDSHDASARAIARRTGAIVVSPAYRLAPEHRFPAAHEDAWTVWKWLLEQVHELGGDRRRMAIAGEDAGANLAANIALRARDEHLTQPIHQILIHPIAGSDLSTPSYGETLRARPVGLPVMRWRFRQLFDDETMASDPRIDLVARGDLYGTAPATIILAEVDPLRSEGEALAEALGNAGVRVDSLVYEGVTQGFFGAALVVTKALFAQTDAAQALSGAFAPGRQS